MLNGECQFLRSFNIQHSTLNIEHSSLAEEVGFEPTVPVTRYGGFQDRCLKPLGHSSGMQHRLQIVFQRFAAVMNFDQSMVTSSVIFSRSLRQRRSSAIVSLSGTVTSL